jgi:hypothetical protein
LRNATVVPRGNRLASVRPSALLRSTVSSDRLTMTGTGAVCAAMAAAMRSLDGSGWPSCFAAATSAFTVASLPDADRPSSAASQPIQWPALRPRGMPSRWDMGNASTVLPLGFWTTRTTSGSAAKTTLRATVACV